MKLAGLKSKVNKLTTAEKRELISFLKSSFTVFDDYTEVSRCPYCQSTHYIKNGTRNNVVRYMCKNCRKTFTFKTNTVISGIYAKNLNKWNAFVEDFIS